MSRKKTGEGQDTFQWSFFLLSPIYLSSRTIDNSQWAALNVSDLSYRRTFGFHLGRFAWRTSGTATKIADNDLLWTNPVYQGVSKTGVMVAAARVYRDLGRDTYCNRCNCTAVLRKMDHGHQWSLELGLPKCRCAHRPVEPHEPLLSLADARERRSLVR